MRDIFTLASILGLGMGFAPSSIMEHEYPARSSRRGMKLPRRDQHASFIHSERPLSKRAKRRARGKAKA